MEPWWWEPDFVEEIYMNQMGVDAMDDCDAIGLDPQSKTDCGMS